MGTKKHSDKEKGEKGEKGEKEGTKDKTTATSSGLQSPLTDAQIRDRIEKAG